MFKAENRSNIKVLVTVPVDPKQLTIYVQVTKCLLELIKDGRYFVRIETPVARPYESNLSKIVNNFAESNFDYWLSIDTDNPPLCNPLDLVEFDKDIIGLATPIWMYEPLKMGENPIYWNGFDYDAELDGYREHYPREGLQRVDMIGTGCFLIAHRVFENPKMRQGPFMREWLLDGTAHKGNDTCFCEKARKEGFEIYCHYDYLCDHYANLSMSEISVAFKNMYEGKNNNLT